MQKNIKGLNVAKLLVATSIICVTSFLLVFTIGNTKTKDTSTKIAENSKSLVQSTKKLSCNGGSSNCSCK